MKRMGFFALRNAKEILRDKLTLIFGLGFPVILLLLLSLIQSNIPVPLFEIASLAPGAAVFGLSFISLFTGLLIAKDKTTSFLTRLFSSPLTAPDYILGYSLPMLPIATAQMLICFAVALALGLPFSGRIFLCLFATLPAAVLFIGLGLLCGTLFNDKQVGGLCGALLTNVSAWLSGTWFDVALLGSWFEKLAFVLPFANAVKVGRMILAGQGDFGPSLLNVSAWALGILILAILLFRLRMKKF